MKMSQARKGDLVALKKATSYNMRDFSEVRSHVWTLARCVKATAAGIVTHASIYRGDTRATVSNSLEDPNVLHVATVRPYHRDERLDDLVGKSFDDRDALAKAVLEIVGKGGPMPEVRRAPKSWPENLAFHGGAWDIRSRARPGLYRLAGGQTVKCEPHHSRPKTWRTLTPLDTSESS